MNKKQIIFLVLGLLFLTGYFVLKYVWKDVDDFSNQKAKESFTFSTLNELAFNTDTTKINKLKGELIQVNGNIKSITKDEKTATIELGDSTSTNSIVCQMDSRHIADVTSLKENSPIALKGKLNGINIDTDMGLGNTIELNYCIISK